MNDTSFYQCDKERWSSPKLKAGSRDWNGHLYASMTTPFVDMTIKGWLWYQGENNMGGTKGNSEASVGYACHQKGLVEGWRRVWSETPGTTGEKMVFLSHLYIKMIILPRQARDKYRESTQKQSGVFSFRPDGPLWHRHPRILGTETCSCSSHILIVPFCNNR